jgi:hypothetical protein
LTVGSVSSMTISFELVPKGILWDSYFCGTA